MLKSMTGFARAEESNDIGDYVWEIRSINHRYLEANFRLPEEVRNLETVLRKNVQKHINRGKLDCTFRYKVQMNDETKVQLNEPLLDQVIAAASHVQQRLSESKPLGALELMAWPGVIESAQLDQQALSEACQATFELALQNLVAHRNEEGERIVGMIEQRYALMVELVAKVRERRPMVLQAIREKIIGRIEELQVQVDAQRLEQELVFLAQKLDVDEELDRLESHLQELQNVIHAKKPAGRRLDFLMQEFNREANTLGSKSSDIETTQAAVDMKVCIEQMREQIQNVE